MSGSRFLPPLLWLAWTGYGGFLFWLSSRPAPPALERFSDKLLHLAAYAVFEILLLGALSRGLRRRPGAGSLLAGLGVAAAYGFSDEWHQSYVAGRVASAFDLIADVAGAAVGLAIFLLLLSWRSRGRAAAGQGPVRR